MAFNRVFVFENIGKGRDFTIKARFVTLDKIFNKYSEAIDFSQDKTSRGEEDGKKLALFNAADYIELAIYKSDPTTHGSASTLFGLQHRDNVTINFK